MDFKKIFHGLLILAVILSPNPTLGASQLRQAKFQNLGFIVYPFKKKEKEKNSRNVPQNSELNQQLVNWIKSNLSPETLLPLSFYIDSNDKSAVYKKMGASHSVGGIIERMIVEEGLDIYDGAVGQIVLTLVGGEENLNLASVPVNIYWEGRVGELSNIRAGYPINTFIYSPQAPEKVSSDLNKKGERGFIFRIINANGRYNSTDPLDGKKSLEGFPNWPTLHWEDWKPVAGENAWVVIAALQLYHKKYFDQETASYVHNKNSIELQLAEELARAALLLQAENGGIRMAPIGTYREPSALLEGESQNASTWWYDQISTENNISWYSALRMLSQITGNPKYMEAMQRVEEYFKLVWNDQGHYFYQGMNFSDQVWKLNDEHFALDVQTWGLIALDPEKIDGWFGEGTTYKIWQKAKVMSGVLDESGRLLGVGYIEEHDRISVEWTAGAIMATKIIEQYYQFTHPRWSSESLKESKSMREGIEFLRKNLSSDRAAYSYSSKREWIPFGWYSHSPEVLSLASTGWIVLIDSGFNPFYLPESNQIHQELAALH